MKKLTLLFFMLLGLVANSQELTVKAKVLNPSNNINDGVVDLQVLGGTPPYSYKWSNQSTSLTSNKAMGLVEGVPYTVVVSDSKGNTVTKVYKVETNAITEIFNGTMTPAVQALGSVLFWDPFAAIGIYDPVAYADKKMIGTPGWSAEVNDRFVLKKWLKPEGAKVAKGDQIAVISSDKNGERTVVAEAAGSLNHLVGEGQVIYNSENAEHVIEQGAHYLAEIVYDEPVVMTHPNGDPITKGIPFIVIWLVLGAFFFTIRMGFINIRGFKHSIDLAKGKYDDPDAPGQVTHFQALATAVSGTVGLGNIAGVAVAVSLGWRRRHVLDDRMWAVGDVVKIRGMYPWGKVSGHPSRRQGFRWSDELSPLRL